MNDTIIFLVLAGIALVFKWLNRERGEGADENPPPAAGTTNELPPRTTAPRAPAQSEEERVRRFLEALGAPAGSAPPPPVRPRQMTPRGVVTPTERRRKRPRRAWVQPLPPLVTVPDPEPLLPPLTNAPEPALPPLVLEPVAPMLPVAPSLVRQTPVDPVASRRPNSLGEMLRAPASARRAIVLREILGPPRGLQPLG